ncbi:hypothetical protein A2U01_0050266 [Trifolium medium]|uniref:Uncharacterized protein n=1 Tax=Trifolium medium TaxID=97028 RepID=A0A392QXI1_9FABA|nr:hypothetical protein [Trifolium medium]
MGQLSRQFSSLQNGSGFGGNTQDNPKKESCNAIDLRSRVVPAPEVRENPKKKESKKGSEGEVEKNERKEKSEIEK